MKKKSWNEEDKRIMPFIEFLLQASKRKEEKTGVSWGKRKRGNQRIKKERREQIQGTGKGKRILVPIWGRVKCVRILPTCEMEVSGPTQVHTDTHTHIPRMLKIHKAFSFF